MPMIHFLPLLPEESAPYTAPSTSGTSSGSSSRSSSISYSTGPSVHSLLTQIKNLTASLSSDPQTTSTHIEDIDTLNREVDYLSYFISAPLSLTPALPGRSNVELDQFNAAIRELNEALAGFSGEKNAHKRTESRHRHKLSRTESSRSVSSSGSGSRKGSASSVHSHQARGDDESRLRMLRRFE